MDSADLDHILGTVRAFIRDGVVPLEDRIEEDDEVPAAIRQTAKDMGLFGFALPEKYGGLGLTMEEESRLVMELGFTSPPCARCSGPTTGSPVTS